MRLTRLLALLFALAAPGMAHAQKQYTTVDGFNAQGVVEMCPTVSGVFLPCGAPGAMPRTFQLLGPANLGSVSISGYTFTNITGQTTTIIKSGAGTLRSITFNAPTATAVVTIFDNTAGSGTKIGTITVPASPQPVTLQYDVTFNTGLTITTGTASSDITVSWR